MENFNLEEYLSSGVEKIITAIFQTSLKNPKESLFMSKYIITSKKARKRRQINEENGKHIPPFLIASITTSCNLHCKGCYARANHSCHDDKHDIQGMLSSDKWGEIFTEAEELGIGFILLAGGEPFLRMDVLQEAATHRNILFPIFTNGTMFSEQSVNLLDKNRNLIPVLSIEGNEMLTNTRRGTGTYQILTANMLTLKDNGILFACSITVTKENMDAVMEYSFVRELENRGCKGIIYVEYVPVDNTSKNLAIDDKTRMQMFENVNELRQQIPEVLFITFPGDEKSSGGCLAAGRGFFHINAHGGAEPCPFSPYSDTNLKDISLRDALQSPLFVKLRENGTLEKEHIGGCILFEQEKEVKSILGNKEL